MKLTEKQLAEIVKQRPELAELLKQKRANKYGNQPTEFGGRRYQSQMEAQTAAHLDILKRLGYVTRWTPQVSYDLGAGISYVGDFEVWYRQGEYRVLDVKGQILPMFKLKAKLFKSRFGFPIDIVKHWKDTPQEGRL